MRCEARRTSIVGSDLGSQVSALSSGYGSDVAAVELCCPVSGSISSVYQSTSSNEYKHVGLLQDSGGSWWIWVGLGVAASVAGCRLQAAGCSSISFFSAATTSCTLYLVPCTLYLVRCTCFEVCITPDSIQASSRDPLPRVGRCLD